LSYDYRTVAETQGKPRYMPVYLLEQQGQLDRIVLPIYGRGMWSTIYGVITLAGDLTTVIGVAFYDHGETPGIGDRIENPAWLEQWRGKRLYTDAGELRFDIRSGSDADAYRVDGITGATVTVSAVAAMIRDWFGPDGYGPFLAALRTGRMP
jgi:Na+-transporting NADH:ubiquinone oxidoreductase subunit C